MRMKVVGGVVISTTDLDLPQWLVEVRQEVEALAGRVGAANDALQDVL